MCEDYKPMPWEIDDIVYYLDDTAKGEFPTIIKGKVEEIHRSNLRIIPEHDKLNLVYVSSDRCFRDVKDLLTMLKFHLNNETTKLDNCVYDW